VGIVDVIDQKAIYFDGKMGEMPGDLADSAASAREALIEGLAELDEDLMTRFLEDEEISADEIREALRRGVTERAIVPVLATSTQAPKSIELFLRFALAETPTFAELGQPGDEFVGLVFNAASDQYLGLMAYVKIYGGTLQEGMEIVDVSRGTKERVREILRPVGDKPEKTPQAGAGEIVVLTKLGEFALGETFAAREGVEPLKLADFPRPVFTRAIEPLTQQDEEKMSSALRELVMTKATLDAWRDEVTHETIVAGMGDTQLNVLVDRLKNRFGTQVRLTRPRVPYKETVTKVAQGSYKHKKQTGGRGQYAEVHLRVEPLERGKGFEFADEIKGGVIPGQFIPAVEKGVVEAMQGGIFGYPMSDIKVAVFFGSHHPVDSSEIAFKIAASQAFKIAVQNDTPVLLEPVMKLVIHTPREFTGDIMSSLSGKRGRILGMEPEEKNWERIEAEAPLAEVQDYALELKSITQGRATFQMDFSYYQPVTSDKLREELLKREQREEQPQ
jgi:elongation factor G